VKKRSIALALFIFFLSSPVYAKTFVGVLWPMFGPLPAIGLVELVAEIKMMPDVEVKTYLHQEWPELVEELARQPKGTRTIVIGYSLGANASVSVANKSKYIDEVIALQPSMLSWNPDLTGKVGHMIEVYNPNPWLTFGGMGSKKLVGDNIEYIANNDSHPGAQFSPQFRNLVKTEITKLSTDTGMEMAYADAPKQPDPAKPGDLVPRPEFLKLARQPEPAPLSKQPDAAKQSNASKQPDPSKQAKQPELAQLTKQPAPPKPEAVAAAKPAKAPQHAELAFLDTLSKSVDSGSLAVADTANTSEGRKLTAADMMSYAQKAYRGSHPFDDFGGKGRLGDREAIGPERINVSAAD
jgi:hypothetical protein